MRRALALAGLAAATALVAAPGPASACYPDRFPYCQSSYCRGLAVLYGNLTENVGFEPGLPVPVPPPWPSTGVAGCP